MSIISRFASMSAKTLSTQELEAIVARRNAVARQQQIDYVLNVLDTTQRDARSNVASGITWLAECIAPSK